MKHAISDCVVVITGASSGIGRATALMFTQLGAAVVLAARREVPHHIDVNAASPLVLARGNCDLLGMPARQQFGDVPRKRPHMIEVGFSIEHDTNMQAARTRGHWEGFHADGLRIGRNANAARRTDRSPQPADPDRI